MRRDIIHSDMNSFYYSVEAKLDPRLRGRAVAVCGSAEERHGIVLAKSQLAKRAGVKTGMTSWEARRLCPELILVPPQYEQYLKYSRLAREIYGRYTDRIEPFGMDEAWCDVTDCTWKYGSAYALADSIRCTIKEELGLTVSIGVSFDKVFAKLGSDMKKPDAITEITPENYREKVWPLPAEEMIYVGPATARKLRSRGVRTIGELAAVPPAYLRQWFGVNGLKLWHYANGTDESRVCHMDFVSPVKSVGHGITCVSDLMDDEEVWRVMLELAQDVGHRLRVHELAARGVQISVRGSDLAGEQFQCRLPFKTQLPSELAQFGFSLFRERYRWRTRVRALCIRAIDLVPQSEGEQLSLFVDTERRDKRAKLQDAVEEVRGRFGKRALTYASLLGDKKMPDDGRDLVRMPGLMYS